jgi:uncharacterized protein YndB with AHSA1/START domain
MSATKDERDFGKLDRSGGRATVRYTRRLTHPPEKVWQALTEPEHLAAWFPSTFEGDREVGAKLRFTFREVKLPPMDGEMLAYEPPALLAFRWGDEDLRFELSPAGAGTLLNFTASFDEMGKAARDGTGWHLCLDRLMFVLDGETGPWPEGDRWHELHAVYAEQFGPDAATIGPPKEWEDVHGPTLGDG